MLYRILLFSVKHQHESGFPCGSAGKESACNAGDLGLIPGLGDPLEKGKATHSGILAWRIPWTIYSQTQLSEFHFTFVSERRVTRLIEVIIA